MRTIQGIIRDTTAGKELELFDLNSLAMIVHELRTAVTLINGYNKVLLKKETGPLTPLQRKILKECQISCKRLINFTGEILELSRAEAKGIKINFQEEAIDQCIRKICRELNPMAQKKGLTLKESLPKKGLPKGYFDKDRIEQVLTNLIKNAIQYTPKGGEVKIEIIPPFKDVFKVYVADNGSGVPSEERESIFEEFVVGRNSNNKEGIGLGLAICKKIVEAHHGKIWVEPGEGGGNRFIFTLPLMDRLKAEGG
jgi:signal transduction histidine kinase